MLLVTQSGFLGLELYNGLSRLGAKVIGTARSGDVQVKLDLLQPVEPQLIPILERESPRAGVICAAMSDPEGCFKDPGLSGRVNVEAMLELLSLFKRREIKPVFFSSDLVFGGAPGVFAEDAPMRPTTLYGRQKQLIEEAIRRGFNNHLIIRTSKLMSMRLHPRNILSPIVQGLREGRPITLFQDQTITPVFIEDIPGALQRALQTGLSGTYHLAATAPLTRIQIGHEVARVLGLDPKWLQPISIADVRLSEPRGTCNAISAAKIERELGFRFTSLEAGIRSLGANLTS